jgi:hypothetical protein
MKLPSFVGLVGGKPNQAYYFCGFVEPPTETAATPVNELIFLDPHIVRESSSPHFCTEPRVLHMSMLDPCMSFGFLIKTEAEFS